MRLFYVLFLSLKCALKSDSTTAFSDSWTRMQWTDSFVEDPTKDQLNFTYNYMNMLGELKYVKADELAPLLTEKSIEERKLNNADQILVFDVRGEEEFNEGHINGAINLPSTKWSNGAFVDEIILQHIGTDGSSAAGKKVVVHCAHSQQRGPTCARLLQQEFQKRVESSGFDLSSIPEM